jgi:hypothetical protein
MVRIAYVGEQISEVNIAVLFVRFRSRRIGGSLLAMCLNSFRR